MPITDRKLKPGTMLRATYKKTGHRLEVIKDDGGEIRYRLGDGRVFRSPSSAGKAVMGGIACNGWRFWSLLDDEGAKSPQVGHTVADTAKKAPRARKHPAKAKKVTGRKKTTLIHAKAADGGALLCGLKPHSSRRTSADRKDVTCPDCCEARRVR